MIVKLHQTVRMWLIAAIAAIATVPSALARDFTYEWKGQTLTYTVRSEENKTCDLLYFPGNNVSGDLVIPATVSDGKNSYTVVVIGNYAFKGCSGLTSVEIPESVTNIYYEVFKDCSNLKSVVYNSDVRPDTGCFENTPVEEITFGGSKAFNLHIKSLTKVTIKNSVTSIDDYAFSECSGLASINIPESVTSIGNGAFSGCKALTAINIPKSVTEIGESTFEGCSGLTAIDIPESVSKIGSYAFSDCSGLTAIDIPESVSKIGSYAFSGCSGLTSIVIPNSVTSIDEYAFRDCSKLKKLVYNCDIDYSFSNPISDIYYGGSIVPYLTLENNSSLETVTFGKGITEINLRYLIEFSSMKSVTFLAEVPPVLKEYYIFIDKETVDNVTISVPEKSLTAYAAKALYDDFRNWKTNEGAEPYSIDGYSYLIVPEQSAAYVTYNSSYGKLSSVDIPRRINLDSKFYTVKSIMPRAFENAKGIKKINFANSSVLEQICYGAFKGVEDVSEIKLPATVSFIGGSAFEDCSGLTAINIPESVTSIGNSTFSGCKALTAIKIPKSVTEIGSFAFKGCSSLTSMEIPNAVTEIGESTFEGCSSLASVNIPESATSIGNRAFSGCSGLTSVEIPNAVTEIGKMAFYDCSGLTSVVYNSDAQPGEWCFKNSVTEVTFGGTKVPSLGITSLTKVTINNSIGSIAGEAFKGCSGLTAIEIPESVTEIGDKAFLSCTGLTEFKFPPFVTEISNNVLASCSNIAKVTFPIGYTSIGYGAFYKCSSLDQEITIPSSVLTIGHEAFAYCDKVKSVKIEDSSAALGLTGSRTAFADLDYLYLGRDFDNKVAQSAKHVVVGNSITKIPGKICTGIEKLELGASLQTIGNGAFNGALTGSVTDVVIPPLVTEIGASAFANNPELKTVKMGYSVATIGEKAFDASTGLEAVYITSNTPPTAADNSVFVNYRMPLYVMPKTTNLYADATPCWYRFFDEGSIIEQTPVTKVKATAPSLAGAKPGDKYKISASVEPADATLPQYFFVSTNPDIASVDNDGNITIMEPKASDEGIETYSDGGNGGCEIHVYSMYADVAPVVIKLDVTSGIDDIITDGPADGFDPSLPYEVYNLGGMMVGTESTNLTPGIYIIRQGSVVRKIAVK